MTKFVLEFDMGNAAFDPDNMPELEVVRILQDVRSRITSGDAAAGSGMKIHDVNGNSIGRWDFVKDEAPAKKGKLGA